MRLRYLGKYNKIYGLLVLPDSIVNITMDMVEDLNFMRDASQNIYVVDREFILNNLNKIDNIVYNGTRITRDYKVDRNIHKKLFGLFNTNVEDWISSRTLEKHILPGCKPKEVLYPREAQVLRKELKPFDERKLPKRRVIRKPKNRISNKEKQVNNYINGKNPSKINKGNFVWKFKYTGPKEDV